MMPGSIAMPQGWFTSINSPIHELKPVFFLPFAIEPSGPPTRVTCYAVTSSKLTVSWSPPLSRDVNGVIISYKLTYRQENVKGERTGVMLTRHARFRSDLAVSKLIEQKLLSTQDFWLFLVGNCIRLGVRLSKVA